jgi:hypothetical protein
MSSDKEEYAAARKRWWEWQHECDRRLNKEKERLSALGHQCLVEIETGPAILKWCGAIPCKGDFRSNEMTYYSANGKTVSRNKNI